MIFLPKNRYIRYMCTYMFPIFLFVPAYPKGMTFLKPDWTPPKTFSLRFYPWCIHNARNVATVVSIGEKARAQRWNPKIVCPRIAAAYKMQSRQESTPIEGTISHVRNISRMRRATCNSLMLYIFAPLLFIWETAVLVRNKNVRRLVRNW